VRGDGGGYLDESITDSGLLDIGHHHVERSHHVLLGIVQLRCVVKMQASRSLDLFREVFGKVVVADLAGYGT
jgi:hypothetical protein